MSGGTPSRRCDEITKLISNLEYYDDASAISEPFFDNDIPRRFRQTMPVPNVPLLNPPRAYEMVDRISEGLHWVCEVRDWTVSPSLAARERQAWIFALGPNLEGIDACWPPVVRSCMTWSLVRLFSSPPFLALLKPPFQMEGFNYPHQQNTLLNQWMSEYSAEDAKEFNLDRTLYRASARSMNYLFEIREFFHSLGEASLNQPACLFPANHHLPVHTIGCARSLSKSTETAPLKLACCAAMGRSGSMPAKAGYTRRRRAWKPRSWSLSAARRYCFGRALRRIGP